eukprot:2975837-Rhodomonas_salina.1
MPRVERATALVMHVEVAPSHLYQLLCDVIHAPPRPPLLQSWYYKICYVLAPPYAQISTGYTYEHTAASCEYGSAV